MRRRFSIVLVALCIVSVLPIEAGAVGPPVHHAQVTGSGANSAWFATLDVVETYPEPIGSGWPSHEGAATLSCGVVNPFANPVTNSGFFSEIKSVTMWCWAWSDYEGPLAQIVRAELLPVGILNEDKESNAPTTDLYWEWQESNTVCATVVEETMSGETISHPTQCQESLM